MHKINPMKRLPPSQVAKLELLAKYHDYIYVTGLPTLRALHSMRLVERRPGYYRQWRITHKGIACLKQNGYYPIYIDLASVRDPRAHVSSDDAERDVRPNFRAFADHLRAEAKWSALLHENDHTGQAASDQRALYDLADHVERVGKSLGFW